MFVLVSIFVFILLEICRVRINLMSISPTFYSAVVFCFICSCVYCVLFILMEICEVRLSNDTKILVLFHTIFIVWSFPSLYIFNYLLLIIFIHFRLLNFSYFIYYKYLRYQSKLSKLKKKIKAYLKLKE